MNVGEVQTTDRFRNIRIRRNLPMTVGVSLGNDLMELSVLSEDVSAEELREILQSYRRKKRFYRMKNGDLLDLSAPSVEELSDLMTAAHLRPEEFTGRQMQIPAFRAMYLDQMLARSQALYGVRDSRFRHLVKEFKTIDESEFEIPKGLASPLRNYQRYGYRWLRTLETLGFGGILADEMG
ncbi:MAG: SNF2 helicase associated domain-containing protein, partial [Lachnospiraceae bacterium]|nr:SNF2 helicase associated domain-containing protein [Lachnospiraceae bacterium]